MVHYHRRPTGSTLQVSTLSETSVYFSTVSRDTPLRSPFWRENCTASCGIFTRFNCKNYHCAWLSRFANHVDERCSERVQKVFKRRSEEVQELCKMCKRGSTCAQNRSTIRMLNGSGKFHFRTVPGTKIDHLSNRFFHVLPHSSHFLANHARKNPARHLSLGPN